VIHSSGTHVPKVTFAELLSESILASKNQAIEKIAKLTSKKFESLDGTLPDIVPTYKRNGVLVKNQATNGLVVNNIFGKKIFVSDRWIANHFPTWYQHDENGKPTDKLLSNSVPVDKVRNRVIAIKIEPAKELAKIQAEKIGGNQKQLDAQYDKKTKALVKSTLKSQPYFTVSRTNLQGMVCSTVDKMPALEAFGLI